MNSIEIQFRFSLYRHLPLFFTALSMQQGMRPNFASRGEESIYVFDKYYYRKH